MLFKGSMVTEFSKAFLLIEPVFRETISVLIIRKLTYLYIYPRSDILA